MEENTNYPISLYFFDDGKSRHWVAEFLDLPGCIGVGDTQRAALQNAEDAKVLWLEAAREIGRAIPPPNPAFTEPYSGKFNLRIPKELHRQLAIRAELEGTSLNALCANLLAARMAEGRPARPAARKSRSPRVR